jgi:hypothetical protein
MVQVSAGVDFIAHTDSDLWLSAALLSDPSLKNFNVHTCSPSALEPCSSYRMTEAKDMPISMSKLFTVLNPQ